LEPDIYIVYQLIINQITIQIIIKKDLIKTIKKQINIIKIITLIINIITVIIITHIKIKIKIM